MASIVHLDKVKQLAVEDVSKLWISHLSQKPNVVSAVVPIQTYRHLNARTMQFPHFVVPLPRSQGIIPYMMQHQGHETHFTPLDEFKIDPVKARSHLSLRHFPELAESHKIVLMMGEIFHVDNSPVLDSQEAQYLASTVQWWYNNEGSRWKLVQQFGKGDPTWTWERVLIEADSLSS